jgi:hypothetical protein
MKLWKITHHRHHRAPSGAVVYLLPCANEPTKVEAAQVLQLPFGPDALEIEFTGFQVAPFYSDLLEAAQDIIARLDEGSLHDNPGSLGQLKVAVEEVLRVRSRSVIVVSGGVVTDVFSTERTMDVSILDTQDGKTIECALQSVDMAVRAGNAGLYRIL